MNRLKELDPDRYTLSLFVSQMNHRAAISTIDTFNYEIAHLRDVIDTPHMGFIRLQWWRDEIKKIYEGKQSASAPELRDLQKVIADYKIEYSLFDELLTAREADFEDHDKFDIQNYARSIHLPLLKIKAVILGEKTEVSPLAEGFALSGLLRAIPFYRARSQVIMPQVNPDAVKRICDICEQLLNKDTSEHKYFKAHNLLAKLYLGQLEKAGYNPEKLYPLPFKELRLWWGTR